MPFHDILSWSLFVEAPNFRTGTFTPTDQPTCKRRRRLSCTASKQQPRAKYSTLVYVAVSSDPDDVHNLLNHLLENPLL